MVQFRECLNRRLTARETAVAVTLIATLAGIGYGAYEFVTAKIHDTLFYELVGVVYNPTNKMFQVGGLEPAEEKYVKEFFQVDGFKNCGKARDKVTQFLKIEPPPAHQFHDDPDVFGVGFQVPYEGLALEVVWEFQTSPWRYVSSSPTNNPGKFDLWTELNTLNTKHRKTVIGNWKAVE